LDFLDDFWESGKNKITFPKPITLPVANSKFGPSTIASTGQAS